jgi:hypothetical protein
VTPSLIARKKKKKGLEKAKTTGDWVGYVLNWVVGDVIMPIRTMHRIEIG